MLGQRAPPCPASCRSTPARLPQHPQHTERLAIPASVVGRGELELVRLRLVEHFDVPPGLDTPLQTPTLAGFTFSKMHHARGKPLSFVCHHGTSAYGAGTGHDSPYWQCASPAL